MQTKDLIIICLTLIIVALIIGGAILMSDSNKEQPALDNKTLEETQTVVENISSDSDANEIVSDEIIYSGQLDEDIRQVTYSDGNFRQYDIDTGELIGSTFESDQKYLPGMD